MNKLESFVLKLSPKLIINGFADNSISYFQLDTPKSALDKFLVTESLASFISSSRVNNESLLVFDSRAIQSEILLPHTQPVLSTSNARRKINRSKMKSKRLDIVNHVAFSELAVQINDLAYNFLFRLNLNLNRTHASNSWFCVLHLCNCLKIFFLMSLRFVSSVNACITLL